MNMVDVIMVRVYITEGSHLLDKIVSHLQKEIQIRGLSVFRAIEGFGSSGKHSSALVDLSLDLPLTIEFFDSDQTKIESAFNYLKSLITPEHVVSWLARANA